MRRALIFDCDGVLVDAEQSGHRRAFNEMWRRLGVGWRWTEEQYRERLSVAGGKERLASLRDDPEFRARVDVPADTEGWWAMVERWHELKTEIYIEYVVRGLLAPRPGVRRLAQAVVDAGWALAVASSGVRRSVQAVVTHTLGEQLAASAMVVSGDGVAVKKPAPDVYLTAAARLGIHPSRCLVVEDSTNGLRAALRAGMVCVVTPTACSRAESFPGAAIVLSTLAAGPGEPMRVLANERGLRIGAEFSRTEAELLVPAEITPRLPPGAAAPHPG